MLKAALLGFCAVFAQAHFADCDPVNDVNDGPFAPAADYEQQIKDSLTDSKAYLKELLEELGEED